MQEFNWNTVNVPTVFFIPRPEYEVVCTLACLHVHVLIYYGRDVTASPMVCKDNKYIFGVDTHVCMSHPYGT